MTKEELIAKFIEQFGDTGEPIDCYFARACEHHW